MTKNVPSPTLEGQPERGHWWSHWWQAGLFVGGCMTSGFLGSYLGGVSKRQPWYDDNPKPKIWPPQWVFPLAWVGNYTFMGIAAWQVWRRRDQMPVRNALTLFAVHLLHNFSFIPIVYQVKSRAFYTLMDTIGLTLGLLTTRSFGRVSRSAGWWMAPYVGWLFFTTLIKFLWWRMQSEAVRRQ